MAFLRSSPERQERKICSGDRPQTLPPRGAPFWRRAWRAHSLAMLPLLCAVLVLLAALLVEYLGHCGWLRRRDSLAGQLVLITGAAGGLGRQLALHFAQQGATLALWDVRRDALEELCEWLLERGVAPGALHPQCVDVADAAAVAREAASQHVRLGPVRVLVNNAAIVYGQPLLGGSTDGGAAAGASVPQLRRSLDVNVAAHFWTVRACVPQMVEEGRGTVVSWVRLGLRLRLGLGLGSGLEKKRK